MGCAETKEEIQSKMLLLRLERDDVRNQRLKLAGHYRTLSGHTLRLKKIPDYIWTPDCEPKERNKKKKRLRMYTPATPMIESESEYSLNSEEKEEANAEDALNILREKMKTIKVKRLEEEKKKNDYFGNYNNNNNNNPYFNPNFNPNNNFNPNFNPNNYNNPKFNYNNNYNNKYNYNLNNNYNTNDNNLNEELTTRDDDEKKTKKLTLKRYNSGKSENKLLTLRNESKKESKKLTIKNIDKEEKKENEL